MNSFLIDDLDASEFTDITHDTLMELEIGLVYPNSNQPRKKFDEEYIQELSSSIVKNGLIQPITVVKNGSRYMIISGECRYKAHLLAKLSTIKAIILDADEKKIDELSLIENIQRDDLTQFEIAKFIYQLWNSGNYKKKKDLAEQIGKRDTYVSRALSVFNLDENIIKDIEDNKLDISISVLDEIARSGDSDIQHSIYDKYKAGDIKRDDIKNIKSKTEKNIDGKSFSKTDLENFKQTEFTKEENKVINNCPKPSKKRIYTSYHTTIDSLDKDSIIFNCKGGTQISINEVYFSKQKYKITIEEI